MFILNADIIFLSAIIPNDILAGIFIIPKFEAIINLLTDCMLNLN